MRGVGPALAAGLRAPVARWRLVLLLWLGRLVPIALVFFLPLLHRAEARSAHHPDAGRLLDASNDATGFAHAWISDFARDEMGGAGDTIFWLVAFAWLLVAILAGGIVTRLVRGEQSGLFLAECGRYAGRFVRLALVIAFLLYCADVACNSLWAARHDETARLHHSQGYELEKGWVRGTLFLAVTYLLGLLHAYARIEIVAKERRSVLLSLMRGLLTLLTRLPHLFVLELAMLGAAGLAALIAWLLLTGANPLHENATSLAVAGFVVLALFGSYLRTGVELGAMDARCRLLAAPAKSGLSPDETVALDGEADADDLFLPPERELP